MTLSRRRFIGSAIAAGALAPLVPILSSRADGLLPPKRLILFHTPNGCSLAHWRPAGDGTRFVLSPWLSGLERHQSLLSILDGVDNQAIRTSPGENYGHDGIATLWSGTENIARDGQIRGGGITVDQYVASRVSAGTPFASLELGVANFRSSFLRSRMSYTGPASPVSPDDDPFHVFDRVFSSLTGGDPLVAERIRAERRSVIDLVRTELSSLRGGLPAADREKIDGHLAGIRALEMRIAGEAGTAASCGGPSRPGAFNVRANDNLDRVLRLQMDLLVAAMKCDLTRVGSILWSAEGTANPTFTWVNGEGGHAVAHRSDAAGQSAHAEIGRWYSEQVAYLLDRLAAEPEGDGGTMLDRTLVVWASAIGNSWNHTSRNVMVTLAGSAGGYLRTGRWVRYGAFPSTSSSNDDHGGEPNNKLLVSICHAMGLEDVETFGNPRLGRGPLPGLT